MTLLLAPAMGQKANTHNFWGESVGLNRAKGVCTILLSLVELQTPIRRNFRYRPTTTPPSVNRETDQSFLPNMTSLTLVLSGD